MVRLLAKIWRRIGGRTRWFLLWVAHDKFMISVTGLVQNPAGEILLLQPCFWRKGTWGMPGGMINRGESLERALQREMREETGLTIEVDRVLRVTSGFWLRMEVCLLARVEQGVLKPNPREILEARFFPPDQLPGGLLRSHREWIGHYFAESKQPIRSSIAIATWGGRSS